MSSAEISPQLERSQFEPLLDDQEAADLLGGIHPKTLQRMARTGQVPAYRVGRYWRYRASELDAWLNKIKSGSQPSARIEEDACLSGRVTKQVVLRAKSGREALTSGSLDGETG